MWGALERVIEFALPVALAKKESLQGPSRQPHHQSHLQEPSRQPNDQSCLPGPSHLQEPKLPAPTTKRQRSRSLEVQGSRGCLGNVV